MRILNQIGAGAGTQQPRLPPPKTVGAVVRQARDALRRYRQETSSARRALQQQTDGPAKLILQLPLPVASAAPPGVPLLDQSFSLADEGDWPGGIVQKFRALRPLAEATLEGYDPQFLGMLEDPADGLGCWSLPDTTACGIVTNATFSSLRKLMAGGYGSRPLQAGHTLIALNPEWTTAADIGQPWERELRQAAQQLLAPEQWRVLYSCRIVRTSRGKGFGLLVGSYGLGWQLWRSQDEESSSVVGDGERCLLWSDTKPDQAALVEAINNAAAAAGGTKKRGLFGF